MKISRKILLMFLCIGLLSASLQSRCDSFEEKVFKGSVSFLFTIFFATVIPFSLEKCKSASNDYAQQNHAIDLLHNPDGTLSNHPAEVTLDEIESFRNDIFRRYILLNFVFKSASVVSCALSTICAKCFYETLKAKN